MRRRTQAEMDQLVAAAGFRKIEQRIDEWGIFTVSRRRAYRPMNAGGSRDGRAGRVASVARAIAWLVFLGPFFYLTYGLANWLAASRVDVPSIVFAWETHIPFLAWTIIPYWSINALLWSVAFRLRDEAELDSHVRRLLTAQLVAVVCFILFPLRSRFSSRRATASPAFCSTR